MKHEDLEDYELFYMELPQADYLKDIEIQDDYDSNGHDEPRGLSEEQVSEIARDSLTDSLTDTNSPNEREDNLFSDQN